MENPRPGLPPRSPRTHPCPHGVTSPAPPKRTAPLSAARTLLPSALVVAALVAGCALARPRSTDLARFALWRLAPGDAVERGTVEHDGARLRYVVAGLPLPRSTAGGDDVAGAVGDARAASGRPPPLLLLHGGFGSWLDWYAEIPDLAATRSLVLVNFRGHGGSTLGDGSFSYRRHAADVGAVLDALGLDRVDVAGWSDGGNAALLLALARPAQVRRIVAISANSDPSGLTAEASAELVGGSPDDAGLARRLFHRAQAAPGVAWSALWRRVTRLWRDYPQLTPGDLARIGAPTLVLLGERDAVRLGHAEAMVRAMPRARLEIVPGVGHDVPQAAATTVLGAMHRFLDGPAAPGPSASGP